MQRKRKTDKIRRTREEEKKGNVATLNQTSYWKLIASRWFLGYLERFT